jgi:hypothetical protein
MMADRKVKSRNLMGPTDRIFEWSRRKTPVFPKLIAVVVMAIFFTFLIMSVQIRVASPEKSSMQRASVIYLRDDFAGRALERIARESGPFPSRFELSQWEGLKGLEQAMMASTALSAPVYLPQIEPLPPRCETQSFALGAKGESFFPERAQTSTPALEHLPLKLAPVIYPLAGIMEQEMPSVLPPFEEEVNAEMSSASWRFLVLLNLQGRVVESVSLENSGTASAASLGKWLQGVHFQVVPKPAFRWISLGIDFTNQSTDGTDSR